MFRGGSKGGLGGQDPPFGETPRFYIEGKNVVYVYANEPRLSS